MGPEILAPAGDDASFAAALAAGADAVYLGLDGGLNARARASNFPVGRLPELCDAAHLAGARLYLTLNTLVFEHELPFVAETITAAAAAGVDALIVQDPAVALLARAIAPTLEVHASTQMTVSSPEGASFASDLGVTRIVVPRELSVGEIRAFAARCAVPLEVFVHGALCMSWSGQCLTSEAWGGRSANRGQCAQSCRLPYELVVDGGVRPTGDVRYLLSPLDLAGIDAIPELCDIGVASLKIEGRLKGPAYVHTAVSSYRRAVAAAPAPSPTRDADLAAMGTTYSRGFSAGFLRGTDHTALVPGRFPKHRGVLLGRVTAVDGARIRVARDAEGHGLAHDPIVVPGSGIGLDTGHPEAEEPGGRVYTVDGDWIELGEPIRARVGDRVFVSSDPRLGRFDPDTSGRLPVALALTGAFGEPLRARLAHGGISVEAETGARLEPARGGADLPLDKLTALGGTPFRLEALRNDAPPGAFLPASALKELRRRLVEALVPAVLAARRHPVGPPPARLVARAPDLPRGEARLVPLCRTEAQLDAVVAAGLPEVELDFMERVGLRRAALRAREAGLRVTLATTRIQKPGEEGYDGHLRRLEPDGVLVRNWGALETFRALERDPGGARPQVHGDFSLNVTNSVTANHLLARGCDTVTAAHDLDEAQLHALLGGVDPARVTVVVHHHVATFHTEHCVYAATLSSSGRDHRTCGRPCEAHRVALRDREGLDHPVVVDVGCRNTVFDARAQCAASALPRLRARGVERFRVEFVWEDGPTAARVLAAWQGLLRGELTPSEVVRRVAAHEQFGVTRGTLAVLGP